MAESKLKLKLQDSRPGPTLSVLDDFHPEISNHKNTDALSVTTLLRFMWVLSHGNIEIKWLENKSIANSY